MEFLVVEVHAEIVVDAAAPAVERAARAHVDGATGSIGVGFGGAGKVHVDRLDGVDGETLEAGGAGGIATAAVGIGAGRADPIEGDTDVLGLHAAEGGAARLGLDVVDIDAGQIFEELADVAVSHVAKNIGGNGVADVHAAALLHDRLRVALALGVDGEGLHLHDPVFRGRRAAVRADEGDLAHGGLAGGDGEGILRGGIAGEGDRDGGRTGGDVVKLKRAVALGVSHLIGAFEADLGVADVGFGRGIIHAALDGAGSGRLGVSGEDGGQPTGGKRGKFPPIRQPVEGRCSHG